MSDTAIQPAVDHEGTGSEPAAGRPVGPDVRAEDRGTLEVRDVALRHLAERVSLDVPGTVRSTSVLRNLAGSSYPRADLRVSGRRALVRLQVAATWPCAASRLAAQVRDTVRDEVARLSGLSVGSVDVLVHLVEPESGSRVE